MQLSKAPSSIEVTEPGMVIAVNSGSHYKQNFQ